MSYVKTLIDRGSRLHSNRQQLLSLWQEIADQFYPERGMFTITRDLGDEFASHLYSSYPLIVRRELGNAFAAMLRPRNQEWFAMTVEDDEDLSVAAREWLDHSTKVQRAAMYDRRTQFYRATKEGDHDFAAFGQCVISREIDWSKETPHLLYRSWHLRDVAWGENYDGTINEIHRNWKPHLVEVANKFPGKLHPNMAKHLDKEPFKKVDIRVVVMDSELFGGDKKYATPWVHAYIDIANQHVIEEVGVQSHGYTIPRWQTVSGTQYAYSPATIVGLPEARLIQAMSLTLLEAGEMATRPPVVATQEAIRSDVNWFAGGITWVDAQYDERLGDVLRPISQDKSGLPFGFEMEQDKREMLASAFYLNKITMPMRDREMTAYEASKLYEQYIRDAIPLFEPMEMEYNGGLCEDTADALLRAGAFGPLAEIPDELQGRDIRFKFESPLHEAIERKKGETFLEAKALIAEALELDQSTGLVMDSVAALREALEGIGCDPDWLREEQDVERMMAEQAQAQAQAQQLAMAEQGGAAAEKLGDAAQALKGAEPLG